MKPQGLIDTGAILALLDRNDRWHRRCVEAFSSMKLPLATSTAVLTELFHLIGDRPSDLDAAWSLIRSEALLTLPISGSDLPELETLMKKYHDRPMDFADASLVLLARKESLVDILTVDHADFETYRVGGRTAFRITPARW